MFQHHHLQREWTMLQHHHLRHEWITLRHSISNVSSLFTNTVNRTMVIILSNNKTIATDRTLTEVIPSNSISSSTSSSNSILTNTMTTITIDLGDRKDSFKPVVLFFRFWPDCNKSRVSWWTRQSETSFHSWLELLLLLVWMEAALSVLIFAAIFKNKKTYKSVICE